MNIHWSKGVKIWNTIIKSSSPFTVLGLAMCSEGNACIFNSSCTKAVNHRKQFCKLNAIEKKQAEEEKDPSQMRIHYHKTEVKWSRKPDLASSKFQMVVVSFSKTQLFNGFTDQHYPFPLTVGSGLSND